MQGINKYFIITFLILVVIFGSIFLWNIVRTRLIEQAIIAQKPIVTIATATAKVETWHPFIEAVGTLAAVNGVSVSTQQPGNIVCINFRSGQRVKKGDLLVKIDDRVEQAQLQDNLAALKLAELTYLRNKKLIQEGIISHQTFDESTARFQQAQASVAQTQALINYKHITAPFDGKTGIRKINLGQYVKQGDPIVSLEAMDPLYVNFFLPEQNLHQLVVNQTVQLTIDAMPNRLFIGRINALNATVDTNTHNIGVQATVSNKDEKLYPGLFAKIKVLLPQQKSIVTVPQTAINYTLYGNTVYVVNAKGKDLQGQPIYVVNLRLVETGEERLNQIIITKGLVAGEQVVAAGQLKLSNGQRVLINNTLTSQGIQP